MFLLLATSGYKVDKQEENSLLNFLTHYAAVKDSY